MPLDLKQNWNIVMKKLFSFLLIAALPLLSQATEKPMAVVQINSAQALAEDAAELAKAIGMPFGPEVVLGGLGSSLMNPTFAGIDQSKPIRLFIGAGDIANGAAPAMIYNFSVEGDGSAYVAAVGQMLPSHEEADGFHTFTMALPDGSSHNFYAAIKNGQASVGPDAEAIANLDLTITEKQKASMELLPGAVSILLDGATFSQMVLDQMETTKEMMSMMQEMNTSTNAQPFEMDPVEMMDSYAEMLTLAVDQLDTLTLSIDLKDNISIYSHLQPKSESTFEAIIAERTAPASAISSFSHPDALMTMFDSFKGFDGMLEGYANWIGNLYSAMGPPFDKMAEPYREMMMSMKGLYSGGYNFLVLPPTPEAPLQFAGIYEISDAARAKKIMDDMMILQAELMKPTEDNPMTMEMTAVSTTLYNNVAIENIHMHYTFPPDESMPDNFANLFTNLSYQMAYLDNYLVYGMGSDNLIREAIDHCLKGTHDQSVVTGFDDLSEELVGFWHMDLARIIGTFSQIFPSDDNQGLAMLANASTTLRGASFNQEGGMTGVTRVQKEDLMGFMQMGMMMKAAQPAAQPGAQMTAQDAVKQPKKKNKNKKKNKKKKAKAQTQ